MKITRTVTVTHDSHEEEDDGEFDPCCKGMGDLLSSFAYIVGESGLLVYQRASPYDGFLSRSIRYPYIPIKFCPSCGQPVEVETKMRHVVKDADLEVHVQ